MGADFAKARYLFGRPNMRTGATTARGRTRSRSLTDSVKPIVDAGQADLVASDANLTEEITMIPTPGHSPGHVSLHIRSEGEEGLLTGDVAHHPCQMAHLDWSSTADFDPRNRRRPGASCFHALPTRPVLVIGGHFDAGHIQRDGDAFKFIALGAREPASDFCPSTRPPNRYPGMRLRRRAVEFARSLFQELPSDENHLGSEKKMKLVRYG